MGGVAGLGYAFKLVAQQASKLLNGVWPGAGSAVSSGVALVGTAAIGKAAVAYYIEDRTIEEAKKKFEEVKNSERSKN